MSARELIKQVAALPTQERKLFDQMLHATENGDGAPVSASQQTWPDFEERLHSIYGEKVAADSRGIIDEGRGGR